MTPSGQAWLKVDLSKLVVNPTSHLQQWHGSQSSLPVWVKVCDQSALSVSSQVPIPEPVDSAWPEQSHRHDVPLPHTAALTTLWHQLLLRTGHLWTPCRGSASCSCLPTPDQYYAPLAISGMCPPCSHGHCPAVGLSCPVYEAWIFFTGFPCCFCHFQLNP